jgi:hypothetical protein
MTFTDAISESDGVRDYENYKVVVDDGTLGYLRGVEIDFVDRGDGQATFVFNNLPVRGGWLRQLRVEVGQLLLTPRDGLSANEIRIGIVGGTGYTGSELLRLLVGTRRRRSACYHLPHGCGQRVDAALPMLRGRLDLRFEDPETAPLGGVRPGVLRDAQRHGHAAAPALLDAGVRVIDLAADFRIKDLSVWEHWYGMEHAAPALVDEAVYGLPELHRDAIAQRGSSPTPAATRPP